MIITGYSITQQAEFDLQELKWSFSNLPSFANAVFEGALVQFPENIYTNSTSDHIYYIGGMSIGYQKPKNPINGDIMILELIWIQFSRC